MFFQYLRKLQLLPPEKKQAVALFLSVTATAMIFGLWLTAFNQKTEKLAPRATDGQIVAEEMTTTSPFAAITGVFKGLTDELSKRLGEFSDQISNFQKTEVWNSYSSSTVNQTFEIRGQ